MGDLDVTEPDEVSGAPYPEHYRTNAVLNGGLSISVRPIKPEDAPLLVEFFNGLSAASVIFRFLTHLKTLPPEWVEHFTRIDYSQDVALVAVKEIESRERILGVCRIMRQPGSASGEIAVVIADDWQGKGIGELLCRRCIGIAQELGMTSIWGIVLPENKKFVALARKLGFGVELDPGAGLYRIEMKLISGSL